MAGLFLRVARHIGVHGRVHERAFVHGGKSFQNGHFNSSTFSCSTLLVRDHQLAVYDPGIVDRRHLRVDTTHQRYVVGQKDALRLPFFVHCSPKVGHIGRVLEVSAAVNVNRASLLQLEADPPPFVRSEKDTAGDMAD
jgi:hypothetical protein